MQKIPACTKISKALAKKLDAIADKSISWDKSPLEEIKTFKEKVMKHGLKSQGNRCVWCTLLVGAKGRRRADRDHIAPKSTYPDWTYTPLNIAIACEYCNGFSVKNNLNTVAKIALKYEDCAFHLVHPYLVDDIGKHIVFSQGKKKGSDGILIKGLSPEGRWTIEKLKLDTPDMTVQRAMDYLYMERMKKIAPHYQDLFLRATGRTNSP